MIDLTWWERGLASLAPEWGLKRLTARAMLEEARLVARGYDGARHTRETAGWRPSSRDATGEAVAALDMLIRRSRDLARNNEWARSYRLKMPGYLIGTGFQPRPVAPAKRAKSRARDYWERFVDTCDPSGQMDWYGQTSLAVGEMIEGGAALIRWRLRAPGATRAGTPWQCEVLPHEMLDWRRTEMRGDNTILAGIEFSPAGERVAYWLWPAHPGEVASFRLRSFQSERVPADEIDHLYEVTHAGLVTGIPWLAATIGRSRALADYEMAEAARKKIVSCLTLQVMRPAAGANSLAAQLSGAVGTDGKPMSAAQRRERMQPGMITYLEPGETVQAITPPADVGAADHVNLQLHALAAGMGAPHAVVTGDISRGNMSSQREAKVDFWTRLDAIQWLTINPQICRPAWSRVMRAGAAMGQGFAPDIRAQWAPPRRAWIDPLKDAKGKEIELALGLADWDEEVLSRGFDPDDHLEKLKTRRAELAAAGIGFGTTIKGQSNADEQDPQS